MRFHVAFAHRLLGEIALSANRTQEMDPFASRHCESAILQLQEIKAENELALAHAGYGRLYRRQGRLGEAHAHFTRALEIFERLGTLSEPERVREELGELPAA